MGMRPLRHTPPEGSVFFVTVQMIQRRFLLRPSPRLNRLIVGILARSQSLHHLDVMAAVFMSNHFHLLVWTPDAATLSAFMQKVNYNLSREVGRLHGWSGRLLARRYEATPVSHEEAAQVERLKYILAHGAKEDLVRRPSHWPGVHCARELLTGEPLRGVWFDGTGACFARRRANRAGQGISPGDHLETHELRLAKLPCWSHLGDDEYRRRIAALLQQVEEEIRARRRLEGTTLPGRKVCARQVLGQDPHEAPATSLTKRPRPRCHAASRQVRIEMTRTHRQFVAAFRTAAERLRAGERTVRFPQGCFPPRLPFVQARQVRAP